MDAQSRKHQYDNDTNCLAAVMGGVIVFIMIVIFGMFLDMSNAAYHGARVAFVACSTTPAIVVALSVVALRDALWKRRQKR